MDVNILNIENLVKPINLPVEQAPARLVFEDFYAIPLTREDLDADLEAVNSSIETIQNTRGGSWPSRPLTKDFDFLDLAWHEREFRDANSFAYVIYSNDDEYLGCFYLYGIGMRTPLNEESAFYEVDASWWVTTKAHKAGYYDKVYNALHQWLTQDFKFIKIAFSNKEIPS